MKHSFPRLFFSNDLKQVSVRRGMVPGGNGGGGAGGSDGIGDKWGQVGAEGVCSTTSAFHPADTCMDVGFHSVLIS